MVTPEAYTHFRETMEYIRRYYQGSVEVGIVLGTGLGGLAEKLKKKSSSPITLFHTFP